LFGRGCSAGSIGEAIILTLLILYDYGITNHALCIFSQWLVEDADSMFVGVNDGYIDIVDTRLVYTISTKIHHVESWGSVTKNAKRSGRYGAPVDEAHEAEYRRKTIQWGKNASLGRAIP
jgi:hypothetical protein